MRLLKAEIAAVSERAALKPRSLWRERRRELSKRTAIVHCHASQQAGKWHGPAAARNLICKGQLSKISGRCFYNLQLPLKRYGASMSPN